ncbi:MAG: YabP/YqfC family sporulation protein [Acutalibacteraceae bacterium]
MPKRRDSRKIYSAAELIKKINALDAGRKYPQVHIEFFGRREASIDGLCGVLEYDGERIRLSAGKEEIVFCGKGLSIDVFDLGQAVIRGDIENVRFCG